MDNATATSPMDGPAVFRNTWGWYLGTSAFWFSTSFKWFILLFLLPDQIAHMVPGGEKNRLWGLVFSVGAAEAMIGPAIFGHLSDRWISRWGRRRPFLVVGAGLTALALLFLGSADQFWMFLVGYLFLQISDDVATGPYSALVPDFVPPEHRGRASGVLSLMSLVAQIAAAIAGIVLGSVLLIYVTIAVINIVCALIVLATVREPAAVAPPKVRPENAPTTRGLARGVAAWLAPWRSMDFRWVWLTRFLNALGFYIILTFLRNYLADGVRVFDLFGFHIVGKDGAPDPFKATIVLALIISLAGAISAVAGGPLADRIGRKRVVVASGWIMFVTLVPFALVPNYQVIALLSPFFGIGYGAYLSATWALATDILPSKEDAGKDMGIWQMSVATPQILAGVVGALIDLGNRQRMGAGYSFAFLLASFAFLLGCVLVKKVKGSS